MSKFVNSALRMCYNLKKLTTNQMFQLYNIYRLVVCYIQKKKKRSVVCFSLTKDTCYFIIVPPNSVCRKLSNPGCILPFFYFSSF